MNPGLSFFIPHSSPVLGLIGTRSQLYFGYTFIFSASVVRHTGSNLDLPLYIRLFIEPVLNYLIINIIIIILHIFLVHVYSPRCFFSTSSSV